MKRISLLVAAICVLIAACVFLWLVGNSPRFQLMRSRGDGGRREASASVHPRPSVPRSEALGAIQTIQKASLRSEPGFDPEDKTKVIRHFGGESRRSYSDHPRWKKIRLTNGKSGLVNSKGKTVIEETDGISLHSLQESPDGKHFYLRTSHVVLDFETGEYFPVPESPHLPNGLGFSWGWLDSRTLLSVSGIQYTDAELAAEHVEDPSHGEEPVIRRSLLYVFDLDAKSLVEVQLPQELRGKVFTIMRMSADGLLELTRPSGPEEGKPFGWFRVQR
jgi:hypothetical protein